MSISLKHAQLLIEELGPNTPEIDTVVRNDDTSWALMFEDETTIFIDWADEPGRLVLSCGLGRAASQSQVSIYETLLSYNLLWQDTGGVRMAIDGPQGEVMLIYDLFDDDLTGAALQTVVLNFCNIASVWRTYVASDESSAALPSLSGDSVHLRA